MKKIVLFVIALLVLIPVLLFVFRKNNIVSREEVKTLCGTPNSKYYDWRDLQIHYTEAGQGEESILMLHGFGGSHKNFRDFSLALEDDYRVIAIDLPAFGLSSVPSQDIPNDELFAMYQSFIEDAVVALELEKYHLVGNSMGGWISWDYALKQDTNLLSLTLLNSAGFGMDKVKGKISGWMTGSFSKAVLKKGVPYSIPESNAKRCLWDDAKMSNEMVQQNYYMINKEGTFPFMLKMIESPVLPDTAALANISVPTLILWGDADEVISVENATKFQKAILKSELKIYKDCGHIPQVEYPNKVAADWQSFVRKMDNL